MSIFGVKRASDENFCTRTLTKLAKNWIAPFEKRPSRFRRPEPNKLSTLNRPMQYLIRDDNQVIAGALEAAPLEAQDVIHDLSLAIECRATLLKSPFGRPPY